MTEQERLGILTYLISNTPAQWAGRTAIVKFCYLLQEVEGVQLGYHFTLYSYGPFDSQVLADIGNAESLGLLRSTYEQYPSGYGYRIESRIDSTKLDVFAGKAINAVRNHLDRVLDLFGKRNAAQLELDSTIVYVQNQLVTSRESASSSTIAKKVREVKPHFQLSEIVSRIKELEQEGVVPTTRS
jgi:hypothetical protein